MALEGLINGSAKLREEATPTWTVHRLRREHSLSFALWPVFEQRIRDFIRDMDPTFDASRVGQLLNEVLQRWVMQPQFAGYALIIEGDTPLNQRVVGHFLGWVQQTYGKPYIILYQVSCDDVRITRAAFRKGMDLLREWKAEANASLQASNPNAALIEMVEHWAIRDAKAWIRFMPELKQEMVFNVMRYKV